MTNFKSLITCLFKSIYVVVLQFASNRYNYFEGATNSRHGGLGS